jgi:molecular chaperone GrpE
MMTKKHRHHDDQQDHDAAEEVHGEKQHGHDDAAGHTYAHSQTHHQTQQGDEDRDEAHDSSEVERLKQQIADLTQALQRERADAVNVRRRSDEERANLGTFYKALVVRELLPVIDNLDRALKHAPKELKDNDYVKGVQSIAKQFEKFLANLGVERIKTVGEPFDPRVHEAVMMEEGDGDKEVVSEELQSGYTLGDEVIRHAMVKVTTSD